MPRPPTPSLHGHLAGPGYDYLEERPYGHELADGLDEDRDGLIDEAHGHGTHIASTILRINPHARILPMRVMSAEGRGSSFDVARAIADAASMGADVINLSLSVGGNSVLVRDAIAFARSQGVAVLSSAGNTGTEGLLFPASLTGVSAVASVDDADRLSSFSAFGRGVVFSAPGENVYAALPDNRWGWWSGTSMACAVASGMTSLAIGARQLNEEAVEEAAEELEWPDWIAAEHVDGIDLLATSSENIHPVNEVQRWDLGWGRLDARRLRNLLLGDD